MENNNDDNDEGYFLEVDVKYSEKLHDPPNVYHFTWKNENLKTGKTFIQLEWQNICHAHKKFKTSTKSCVCIEGSA